MFDPTKNDLIFWKLNVILLNIDFLGIGFDDKYMLPSISDKNVSRH